MKVTRCPQKGQCWDYGKCDECETGRAFMRLEKKVKKLEEKVKRLEEANKVIKQEIAL